MKARTLILSALLVVSQPADAREPTNRAALLRLSEDARLQVQKARTQLYYDLLQSTNPATRALNLNPDIQLMYIEDGVPVYYGTRNLDAANTIGTGEVWPGGSSGYSLTGAGTPAGQLAIWDVGATLVEHEEFTGRVRQLDNPAALSSHATSVAGTMVAAGLDPRARGMAFEATLDAYDWEFDVAEMGLAAFNDLQVSNHSYGRVAGWRYNWKNEKWYWYGDMSIHASEDYRFGFYDLFSRAWDLVAYHAPYYLIVNAAGNERTETGPDAGGGHFHWDGAWVWATDFHRPDGAPSGYDTIAGETNAKNILTVGAVLDIPGGYKEPGDVILTSYSSWGPTDDGRIRPDVVANGDSLFTISSEGIALYDTLSGTSAASPTVTGSVNLLVDHYRAVKDTLPRASTLKALVIFSADEAGDYPGPDYQHGWGLVNTSKAAVAIERGGVAEAPIVSGRVRLFEFSLAAAADVRTTIVWTDVVPSVFAKALDAPTRALVNDLDLRIEHIGSGTLYEPWVLDRKTPEAAATKGDNRIDNVEQIDIANAAPGDYRITVSHKGSLATRQQWFSIVCSEVISDYPVTSYHAAWVDNAVEIEWSMTGATAGYGVIVTRTATDDTPEEVQGEVRDNGTETTFRDESIDRGKKYTYAVSILEQGSEIARFETTIRTPPHLLFLRQNSPNPFSPATRIDFDLAEAGHASLRIYDVAGRLVRTLVSDRLVAGPYSRPWDGRDSGGNRVASGVYFYRLEVPGQALTKKMVVLR